MKKSCNLLKAQILYLISANSIAYTVLQNYTFLSFQINLIHLTRKYFVARAYSKTIFFLLGFFVVFT